MTMFSLRRIVAVTVLAVLLTSIPRAFAAWDLTSTGAGGAAKARTMPAGEKPTVAVTGRSAAVTWVASQFPNGVGVDNYEVSRYNAATGVEVSIGSSCASLIDLLTCTEQVVPPGDWEYAVTPHRANWTGAESPKSSSFNIASPELTLTTDVSSLETTLNGTITSFTAGQTVEFRLDDPNNGTVLASTVTPNTVPAVGTAVVAVTIPKGTSNGSHTVYAIGSSGDTASTSINVNVTPPSPTALTTTNVGTSGRPDQGDSFRLTYSQALDVGSLCSDWSGDSSNQAITADSAVAVRIRNNAAASGNDLLDIYTAAGFCGSGFNMGSIDLGTPNFVTGDTYWGGAGASKTTITWTPATSQLLVTLGARAFGNAPNRVNSSVTATYTPSSTIRNTSWVGITGTVSNTGVQF
jgi:hypothetical protein